MQRELTPKQLRALLDTMISQSPAKTKNRNDNVFVLNPSYFRTILKNKAFFNIVEKDGKVFYKGIEVVDADNDDTTVIHTAKQNINNKTPHE